MATTSPPLLFHDKHNIINLSSIRYITLTITYIQQLRSCTRIPTRLEHMLLIKNENSGVMHIMKVVVAAARLTVPEETLHYVY